MAEFLFAVPYKDLGRAPVDPNTAQGHEELLAYASYIVAHEILPKYPGADVKVIEGTLEEDDAELIRDHEHWFSHGHGDYTIHATKHDRVFLADPTRAVRGMGGRVVHLLSCRCGAKLIPSLTSEFGTDAAIGYEDYFYIGEVNSLDMPEPWEKEISPEKGDARTAVECDLEIQKKLLEGRSLEEALKASQERFKAEIDRYENGDRSHWGDFSHEMAKDLLFDMKVQVMYKSGFKVRPSLWEKYGPGLAVGAVGLGAVMLGKPELEERGLI